MQFGISLAHCHPEWQPLLNAALKQMDSDYLNQLTQDASWLPGPEHVLASFSMPLSQTHYVLMGESPYPRAASANGYAFWDGAVDSLWSPQGLSKQVNRATSLRNWIKMLLLARGDLQLDTSQHAITQVDKTNLVKTASEFFTGMMHKGILLLNATLVYNEGNVPYHARHWKPFMHSLLSQLAALKPDVQLITFGKIADTLPKTSLKTGLVAEHPYNISFIINQSVINFFQPLDLLANDSN